MFLVLAVIFVNGATDAPNSIAGAVGSGVLKYRSACILCAVFNFLGLVIASTYFPSVTKSIESISIDRMTAIPLITVIIFSSVAWFFGIPTSESHALVASLGGVSLYTAGKLGTRFIGICVKSAASCAGGFGIGALFVVILSPLFHRGRLMTRGNNRKKLQGFCAAFSAACHGMQDGQKFTAMLIPATAVGVLPASAVMICSAVMGMGCLAGGRRITKKLGEDMIVSSGADSAASDAGALVCTLVSTFLGIPVSTTYMKTCSMLGAAAAIKAPVNRRVVLELVGTWVATYPVCMMMSYLLCLLRELII